MSVFLLRIVNIQCILLVFIDFYTSCTNMWHILSFTEAHLVEIKIRTCLIFGKINNMTWITKPFDTTDNDEIFHLKGRTVTACIKWLIDSSVDRPNPNIISKNDDDENTSGRVVSLEMRCCSFTWPYHHHVQEKKKMLIWLIHKNWNKKVINLCLMWPFLNLTCLHFYLSVEVW